jgi:hypothetical protein
MKIARLLLSSGSLALAFVALTGCQMRQVQFRNFEASGLDVATDPGVGQAAKVALRFEVIGPDGKPMTHLGRHSFAIYEDGVRSTSEALAYATGEAATIDVALLLDDSRSMYEAPGTKGTPNAVVALKQAAAGFMQELESNPRARFRPQLYRFANSVEPIASLDEIPDHYVERGEHFTSLYHAIAEAARRHPRGIIVVFSDGADNYSQNHGTVSLDMLLRQLRDTGTPVHAIGFGDLRREYDRHGIQGERALRRIAQSGSIRLASDPERFRGIFREIADRITAIYTLTYYSPNLSGRHSLVIKVDDGFHHGSSPTAWFGDGIVESEGRTRSQSPESRPREASHHR